jgi:two-component sensor histidine kinase
MEVMLKLFCLSIFVCFTMRSNSQLKTDKDASVLISSLQKKLADSTKVELLLDLSRYYYFELDNSRRSLDSMYRFLHEADQICDADTSLHWDQSEIYCYLGKYYHKTGNIQLATQYDNRVIASIESISSADEQLAIWDWLGDNIKVIDTIGLTRVDCSEHMLSIYRRLDNKEHEIGVRKDIADMYLKQGKLELAEKELIDVLAKYKAINFKNLHDTYYLLSVTNQLKGNYGKALEYGLLTIESMQKENDYGSALTFYFHLAHLYDDLGQTNKSIEYYHISFKQTPPNPINYYYIREVGFLVMALLKENRKYEAGSFLADFAKKNPPADNLGRASLARTFAFYYNFIHNYDRADKYMQEMIRLEPLLGKNNEIKGDVEYDIGQYYFNKQQFTKASAHFDMALDEAVLNNSANTIKNVQLMLFKTDSSLGKYTSAIRHLNEFRQLNDSIFNETKNKQIDEVQAKYETEKKEQNIRLLEKENNLQQNRLLQASYTRNWILGGTMLLLVIVALLMRNIKLKQRTSKRQKIQQLEIERQNGVLRHLINEKEWLLKEIHHRVKNNLQIVMSLLNSQSAYIDNEPARTAIHDSQHRVHAMSLIHQKLYNSEDLSSIDMSVYIRELASYLADSFNTGQRIRFQYDIQPLEMDVSQAVPLGLILNEAITNSIKYAFPDNRSGAVSISLSNTAINQYLLTISDNGIGIASNLADKKIGSLGMSLMQGLSEDLNGNFSIENKNGTIIKISFIRENAIRHQDTLASSIVSNN